MPNNFNILEMKFTPKMDPERFLYILNRLDELRNVIYFVFLENQNSPRKSRLKVAFFCDFFVQCSFSLLILILFITNHTSFSLKIHALYDDINLKLRKEKKYFLCLQKCKYNPYKEKVCEFYLLIMFGKHF